MTVNCLADDSPPSNGESMPESHQAFEDWFKRKPLPVPSLSNEARAQVAALDRKLAELEAAGYAGDAAALEMAIMVAVELHAARQASTTGWAAPTGEDVEWWEVTDARLRLQGLRIMARLSEEHRAELASLPRNRSLEAMAAQRAFEDERRQLERALEVYHRILGDDHPDTLTTLHNLGVVSAEMGQLGTAIGYSERSLQGRRRILGEWHPDTLATYNTIGLLYSQSGDDAAAMPYQWATLTRARAILGDDDYRTIIAASNVGDWLARRDPVMAAIPIRWSVESARRVLGPDHPTTLFVSTSLGWCLLWTERQEAEALLRATLDTQVRTLGGHHMDSLRTLGMLARHLRMSLRCEEAIGLRQQAVAWVHEAIPEDHEEIGTRLVEHARTLWACRQFEDAEEIAFEALDLVDERLDAKHRLRTAAGELIDAIYLYWEAAGSESGYDDAAAARREAWVGRAPKSTENHDDGARE